MKLSKETLALIKNYSSINSNMLLKQGNQLRTISAQKNIMADSNITETFPIDFGIYDLNEFLGALSLFEDPDLQFNDKYVVISDGSNSLRYYSADPTILIAPQKSINFPESDIDLDLSEKDIQLIHKTSSVLRAGDLSFVGSSDSVKIVVGDKKNATSNSFSIPLTSNSTNEFKVNFKVENLKMIPGDYQVSLSAKKISRFKHKTLDLVYYVAIEADSSFE